MDYNAVVVTWLLLRKPEKNIESLNVCVSFAHQVLFCRLTEHQKDVYQEYLSSRECHEILRGNFMVRCDFNSFYITVYIIAFLLWAINDHYTPKLSKKNTYSIVLRTAKDVSSHANTVIGVANTRQKWHFGTAMLSGKPSINLKKCSPGEICFRNNKSQFL